MKSRKSIFCVALAALMLVAFTACENSAPTTPLYGKEVLSVVVTSVPEYIVGETVDPSAVSLRVNYNDNSYDEYTGIELGMAPSTLSETVNTLPVSVGGKDFNVVINAYNPEGYTLDFSGMIADTMASDADLTLEGLVIGVVYNGDKVKTQTAPAESKIPATVVASFIAGEKLKVGDEFTISAENIDEILSAYVSLPVTVTGSWTLEVIASGVTLEYITAEQTNELFAVGENTSISKAGVIVTGHYSDGSTKSLYSGSTQSTDKIDYGWTFEYDKYEKNYVFAEPGTYPTVLKGTKGDEVFTVDDFAIVVSEDYAESFTAVQIDTAEDPSDPEKLSKHKFVSGEDISNDYFRFDVVWASGYEDYGKEGKPEVPTTYAKSSFEATPDIIKEGQKPATDYKVNFIYTPDETIKVAPATVTVVAPTTEG